MGSSGMAEAVSPLLGHLDDTSPEVREEVARALGRIGGRLGYAAGVEALRIKLAGLGVGGLLGAGAPVGACRLRGGPLAEGHFGP